MNNNNILDFHIPRWEELPNIDLYLDQVVTLLEDYLKNLISIRDNKNNKVITKTMINNYVKNGILKPPVNKKYNKAHIARLIVICILKQVYSINDIHSLIKLALETSGIEISYNKFCTVLEKSINSIFDKTGYMDTDEMTEQRYILKNVVQSFANKLYVEKNFLNK